MKGATQRRFDLVELVAVSAFVGIAVWCLGAAISSYQTYSEAEERAQAVKFSELYGPSHFSQGGEEWAIRDFFKDKRNGFFVDVGANHYKNNSNTYYLEASLGWSGIAVEPQREFEPDYVNYRPKTRFMPFFVAETSNEQARLYVSSGTSLVTSADKDFTARWGELGKQFIAPTISLNDLLDRERVARVDLLSIDVELHEPQVLAGFDIDRFTPLLVCIEVHLEVRQRILDYFARHRYVVVGKYLRLDTVNLYFSPLR